MAKPKKQLEDLMETIMDLCAQWGAAEVADTLAGHAECCEEQSRDEARLGAPETRAAYVAQAEAWANAKGHLLAAVAEIKKAESAETTISEVSQ